MNELFNIPPMLTDNASNSNEWYTPTKYIEAARSVMDRIDLDPASCEKANQIVRASRYYTEQENGLTRPWSGRIWLNPPYSASPAIPMPQFTWAQKLLTYYHRGQVEQAVLLIMACVKQKWFHDLWAMIDAPICFTSKRIYFLRPAGPPKELRESTCFIYLGPNEQKFIETFSQFGTIAKHVNPIKPKYTTLKLWDHVESDGAA